MISPQVVNLIEDAVMMFDGDNVITSDLQTKICSELADDGKEISTEIVFYDMRANAATAMISTTMTYVYAVDMWRINTSSLTGVLEDMKKYVALVSEAASASPFRKMRQFKINEFVVDNNSFEKTLMRMPYQIEISTTPTPSAYIRWYATTANFTTLSLCKYEAAAYEGTTGTDFATDPSRITHRGPIIPYVAV